MGITEDRFWHMNPRKIKPYIKAFRKRQELKDEDQWIQGRYIYEATATAIENVLNGNKSRLHYRDKSYTKEWEENHLTDEQKRTATLALFAQLEHMQESFEKTHPKNDVIEDEMVS